MREDRPLPKRLKPDESWATWIYVDEVPSGFVDRVTALSRARLSTGRILKATDNMNIPPVGTVPGGPISIVDSTTTVGPTQ